VGGPVERREAWRAFGHLAGMWMLKGVGSFIMERRDTGATIGSAGPWIPEDFPEREIGWTLWDADAEGQGFAFEAADAACDFAFKTLGWDTAVSYIDFGNDRSLALAKRLGAVEDPDATQPKPADPCHVYRHPARKVAT